MRINGAFHIHNGSIQNSSCLILQSQIPPNIHLALLTPIHGTLYIYFLLLFARIKTHKEPTFLLHQRGIRKHASLRRNPSVYRIISGKKPPTHRTATMARAGFIHIHTRSPANLSSKNPISVYLPATFQPPRK